MDCTDAPDYARFTLNFQKFLCPRTRSTEISRNGGAEQAIIAQLDELIGTSACDDTPPRSKNWLSEILQIWRDGETKRNEELKNSPLAKTWKSIDQKRKADNYKSYNTKRRSDYAANIAETEGREVRQYSKLNELTAAEKIEKKEYQRELARDRKRKSREKKRGL